MTVVTILSVTKKGCAALGQVLAETNLDQTSSLDQDGGVDPFQSLSYGPPDMRRFALLLLVLFLVAFTQGADAASPAGSWRGSWSSQTSGHRGPMRARIRATGPDTYRAVFVGRFAGVVPFVYPAKLQRVAGTCDCYTSSQRLPLLGTYRMTASVSPSRFHATFQGRKDSGTFDMAR